MEREQCMTFACGADTLVGIVSLPPRDADTCVVIVVGGPQYRVGSHRLFVQLARRLADHGHAALRFDLRGMGDSSGVPRGFEDASDDIGNAIDAAQRRFPGLQRFVLSGLCDGASAALMYLQQRNDRRIAGLCLLNPWVRSEVGQARTRVKHYYLQRLQQKEFWVKLFSGTVGASAVAGLARNMRLSIESAADPRFAGSPSYHDRMAAGWAGFAGRTLLILSGKDFTAKEFIEFTRERPAWKQLLLRQSVRQRHLPEADHTFSGPDDTQEVSRLVCEWMRTEFAPALHEA